MKGRDLFWAALGVSAGALVYGAVVESNRLLKVSRRLQLPHWPARLEGFRIAVLGDFHVRDTYSADLAKRAIEVALDAAPDMVVLVGDYVAYWKPGVLEVLAPILEPLLLMQESCVAVLGNHDYQYEDPGPLVELFDSLNIKLLRNECWVHAGINWVGIDSANAGQADPLGAMMDVDPQFPTVAIWHEPDMVDWVPGGVDLVLSGHSHGGQFLTPWGKPFVGSKNGRRYRKGFYPDASTPIFVTSGVGTTGPPSRLFCPPEVVVLTLCGPKDSA